MKKHYTVLLVVLVGNVAARTVLMTQCQADDQQPVLVSALGSERATSGAGAKIVTFGDMTHVIWQDADDKGAYLNRIRSLDRSTGQWTDPFTLNRGKDSPNTVMSNAQTKPSNNTSL